MKPFELPYDGLVYTIVHIEGHYYFADTGHVFFFSNGKYTLYKKPMFINKASGRATRLDFTSEGIWRDVYGTPYGLRDDDTFVDLDPRAGVWPFELPESWSITDASRPHDARFSIPVYQMYHTEKEANDDFERDMKISKQPKIVRKVLKFLVDQLGFWWWDNKKTQLK